MSPSSTQINDESLAYPNSACGFAAFLAESLWLSVSHVPALRLRRGGRSLVSAIDGDGKPEAFRKGRGKAAT
jgi:hypothetical protein